MRLGIDLGGTKIEAVILSAQGKSIWQKRIATSDDYDAIISSIHDLINEAEQAENFNGNIGMGIPGSLRSDNKKIHGASLQCLNGRDFKADCEAKTGRKFKLENDANCFALSEAKDGAAKGYNTVFGVILGTGCGGGWVVDGKIWGGGNNIAGEWGHTPLPWLTAADEIENHDCWCGLKGCLETYLAGPALSAEYNRLTGQQLKAEEIAGLISSDKDAKQVIEVFEERLARALSQVITLIDPDAIVIGGGLSNLERIYTNIPKKLSDYVFSDAPVKTPILKPKYGDASGVRGAAFLWSEND